MENIHTCIDTSGFAGQASSVKIFAFTDLVLFDLKIGDFGLFWEYTRNIIRLILGNLD